MVTLTLTLKQCLCMAPIPASIHWYNVKGPFTPGERKNKSELFWSLLPVGINITLIFLTNHLKAMSLSPPASVNEPYALILTHTHKQYELNFQCDSLVKFQNELCHIFCLLESLSYSECTRKLFVKNMIKIDTINRNISKHHYYLIKKTPT